MFLLSVILVFHYSSTNGQLLGGRVKLDPNDPVLKEQAIFAIEEYNKLQNSQFELFEVLSGTKQLVRGTLYDFLVQLIECDKNKRIKCHFVTLVVPWLNKQNLESSSCQSDNPIFFNYLPN